MADPLPIIEPLGRTHDRAGFSCGEPALDGYLQRQASQDMRRRVSQVFVAVGTTPERIAGFYSLNADSFEKAGLPATAAKQMPHYPVPAAMLGRLAVDLGYQGRGLGEMLLIDAVRRVLRASAALAIYAVVVDAKNDRARTFYERYGFRAFEGHRNRLSLPLETFEKLGL